MRLFITGIGSGLGKALVEEALKRNYEVFALSRRMPKEFEGKIRFYPCDLKRTEGIYNCMEKLLKGLKEINLAILNAGVLGEMKDMHETSLLEIEEVFKVNLWANKVIIDYFIDNELEVEQIIAISSGAAKNCNRGWNAYSLSKAGLNCLIKLYSWELPKTHLIALAPGLVLTPMLEEVTRNDEKKFTSIARIKNSPKLLPEHAARFIFETLPKLKEFESGSFVDLRDFPEYGEYIKLWGVV